MRAHRVLLTLFAMGACAPAPDPTAVSGSGAPSDAEAPAEDAGANQGADSSVPPAADAAALDSGPGPALDAGYDGEPDAGPLGPANLRVIAANLTSGGGQSYDSGEGLRILQGLAPDVVLIQEFNYGANTDDDARALVDKAFGKGFSFYREPGAQIPNGIISRFSIEASGTWTDPAVANRGFVWAKIAAPGSRALWAISLHLLTTSSKNRDTEAAALVAQVKATVPQEDYLVVGGDLNTEARTEPCMTTLGQIVLTAAPFPDDGKGNDNTNGPRSKPHDWLLADPDLISRQVPTVYGGSHFPKGLVFDSRVYTPLTDVPPITAADSAASGMQHMAVVKDFRLP